MTQSGSSGSTTRTGLRLGTGRCRIAVCGLSDGRGIRERTIGGRLPGPGIGTRSGTGCRLGGGSRIVGGGQCRNRHRGSAGAAGAGTLN